MAVVFAKVARIDYPKAWLGLFTDLLQQLQSQNTLVVRRVYLVLHHALKELASKRLSSDQKAFGEVNIPSPSWQQCTCVNILSGIGSKVHVCVCDVCSQHLAALQDMCQDILHGWTEQCAYLSCCS